MLTNTAKSVTSSGLPLRLHSCRTEQHHVLNRDDDGTISRSEPDFERVQVREVHRTSHLSVTTMLATHHAGKVTDERLVLWTSAGKDRVILRLVTGLVAQRRAESATCSRRHAVNLVPLDEFALGSGESPLTELAFALLVAGHVDPYSTWVITHVVHG